MSDSCLKKVMKNAKRSETSVSLCFHNFLQYKYKKNLPFNQTMEFLKQ